MHYAWRCSCCSKQFDTLPLDSTDHPLSVDQRKGITMERVQEIVAALMHRH
jgi:hypothetical protein